jgi:predicted metal-binding membrane protein
MIPSRREFARVRSAVIRASVAAWLVIAASPYWLGQRLPDFLCSASPASWLTAGWVVSAGLGWLLMIVAMMAPMNQPAIVHIRVSTFAGRRLRAVSLFFVGFVVVWLVPGVAMKALRMGAGDAAVDSYGPAAWAALAACVWQVSPYKQYCLNGCHTHRALSAFGWRADVDVLRLGLTHGMWCVGTCWAMMLSAVLLPHWHLAGMAVVSVLLFCERLDAPRLPAWRIRGWRTAGQWLRREIAYLRASGAWRRRYPEPHAREQGVS